MYIRAAVIAEIKTNDVLGRVHDSTDTIGDGKVSSNDDDFIPDAKEDGIQYHNRTNNNTLDDHQNRTQDNTQISTDAAFGTDI